jgi:integrase
MAILGLHSSVVPPTLTGQVCVGPFGLPRYWASIWIDILKGPLRNSTRRLHLSAVDRLYDAAQRQRGFDCLDRLITDLDIDPLLAVLSGFSAQLRNEAAVRGVNHVSTWSSALTFITDVLRRSGVADVARSARLSCQLLSLEAAFRGSAPAPSQKPSAVRALPALVIEDLYEIFNPLSERNPFKGEFLRWRNLLIFMLFLRLGLRRGEITSLGANAIKTELDLKKGKEIVWIDVEATVDEDPRYCKPSLKTGTRQLPIPQEIRILNDKYLQNYRGQTRYGHLLISRKNRPLSVRSVNEIFETATDELSIAARKSLEKQGLEGVSCHDLRHTCAVVRMRRYQENGDDLDKATEKLRVFFGWSPESEMPRLYARAYFETKLNEVWDEKFDNFVGALRNLGHKG